MQFFEIDKRYYGTRIAQSLNSYVAKHVVRFLHLFKFGLVVFSEFISEGIGGSRETPAYCFFIINSEKTTDGFERSNNACTDECKHSSTEQWRENLVNKLTIPRHRSIVATQLLSSHCLTYSWKR